MDAGKLNCRVVIRYYSGTDDLGQPTTTPTTLATVWANVRYPSGTEAIKADGQASIVKASVRIRRRTDVTAAMEVVHGSTVMKINAVLPDEEDREFMFLVCEVT